MLLSGHENNRMVSLEKIVFPLCLLCFSVLILLRDVGGIGVHRVIFIGMATVCCLLSNKMAIYCLLAFLTPLSAGISATYISAIALVILLLKQRRMYLHFVGLMSMLGILVLELLSALRGRFDLVEYLRFIGVFAVAFLYMIDGGEEYDHAGMIRVFLLGYCIAMASIMGQMMNQYSLEQIFSLSVRLGNTRDILQGTAEGIRVSYNPNGLGVLCVITTMLCLVMNKKTGKVSYMILFGIASLFGIMTQSRTFILAYAMGLVAWIFLAGNGWKAATKRILIGVLGLAALGAVAVLLIPEYIAGIVMRFQVSDLGNGRGEIMVHYFEEIFRSADRILFGVGMQDYADKCNYDMRAHNATQEVLVMWGALGLVAAVVLFVAVFRNSHSRNPDRKPWQMLPLCIYLICLQMGQGFSVESNMLRVMVTVSAMCLCTEPKVQQEAQESV